MIVIPMAGLSQRFFKAGYKDPKYMLEAQGRTVFEHAAGSFERYFASTPFLFIVRDVFGTSDFVRRAIERLGIADATVAVLDRETKGQAETVALGLDEAGIDDDTPLTIFNIDTFRPDFAFPSEFDVCAIDGYLEVFRGEGANWSYVEPAPGPGQRVVRTTEKVPISDLCCTGLYHFGHAHDFREAYDAFQNGAAAEMGLTELYVAPMYNLLIQQGRDIRYSVIEPAQVIFCGVPAEYEAFKENKAQ